MAGDPPGPGGSEGERLIWPGQPPHSHDHFGDGAGKIGGPVGHMARVTPHKNSVIANGPLSYGPPGVFPGFYGFGLAFHRGYGYGGNGLGVGADGGHPCYGGPGYSLHYGYPHFAFPYYEGIGSLVQGPSVVLIDLADATDFGPFTGASSYAYTHSSATAEASARGSYSSGNPPATGATVAPPEAVTPGAGTTTVGRYLGMDLQPSAGADGGKGLKIVNVLPDSTAEQAGLQIGDVIRSANGHVTEQVGHLGWIIANAAPDNVLKMTVLKAGDAKERVFTLRIP
jgi:hypothetical protein